jgi:hypothetical protein
MAISYNFQVEDKLLKVIAQGKDESLNEVEGYGIAILRQSIQNNCTHILCDERKLEYALSVKETFVLADEASRLSTDLQQIAIVCSHKNLHEGQIYEAVAKHGGLKVMVTANMNQAMEWLK